MKHLLAKLSLLVACGILASCATGPMANIDTAQVTRDSRAALDGLYRTNPKARNLANRSEGVLVFPKITKAGFMVGGMGGNGTLLLRGGGVGGHYQTGGLSYGLQAGAQQYGYALFLMNDRAIGNINRASGWDLGTAPSVVVLDQGAAGSISLQNLDKDAYAVFFNQKGLMAGLGLQGTKVTRIRTDR